MQLSEDLADVGKEKSEKRKNVLDTLNLLQSATWKELRPLLSLKYFLNKTTKAELLTANNEKLRIRLLVLTTPLLVFSSNFLKNQFVFTYLIFLKLICLLMKRGEAMRTFQNAAFIIATGHQWMTSKVWQCFTVHENKVFLNLHS